MFDDEKNSDGHISFSVEGNSHEVEKINISNNSDIESKDQNDEFHISHHENNLNLTDNQFSSEENKVAAIDSDNDDDILHSIQPGNGEISIEAIFDCVRTNKGSDLHITTGEKPKMRLMGDIFEVPGWKEFTEEETKKLLYETMSEDIQKKFDENWDVDYSYLDRKNRRYRANAMITIHGLAGIFRIISQKILTFEELNLPEQIKRISEYKKGLVLVTGSTGSGKSTTLASIIDYINRIRKDHILTIEDPVEIIHKSKKSLINHREINTNTKSFSRALKSALREDPDSIMIGEMRDLETISLALTAAETGHLVFGTLHTNSAANTINRIVDVFSPGEQGQIRTMLAEGVRCIISQVLCRKKGEKGRIAAFEILFGTDGVRNLIREEKIFQIRSAIEVGMREGMQTLDQSLKKLVLEKKITIHEAKKHARYPEDVEQEIRKSEELSKRDKYLKTEKVNSEDSKWKGFFGSKK